MHQHNQKLLDIISPVVSGLGYELLGIERLYYPSRLRLYIDKKAGITLQDCEKVNKQIDSFLRVENKGISKYLLEVSSPGVNRPLFTLEQIKKYIGCTIKFKLSRKQDGKRVFQGHLLSVKEHDVCIEVIEGESQLIPIELIAQAQLVGDVDFSKYKIKHN